MNNAVDEMLPASFIKSLENARLYLDREATSTLILKK